MQYTNIYLLSFFLLYIILYLLFVICYLILQAHVAVEGAPVIQKYLETLTSGDVKVSLSGFQRWTLGQQQ